MLRLGNRAAATWRCCHHDARASDFGSQVFVICDEPARRRDEQVTDPDNLHVGGADASGEAGVAR